MIEHSRTKCGSGEVQRLERLDNFFSKRKQKKKHKEVSFLI